MKKATIILLFSSVILLLCVIKSNAQSVIEVTSIEFYERYHEYLENPSATIIDGRSAEMFAEKHLANAINIDAFDDQLPQLLESYLEEPLLILYCTTRRRSDTIIDALQGKYNGEIIMINDGITGWMKNELPIISNPSVD